MRKGIFHALLPMIVSLFMVVSVAAHVPVTPVAGTSLSNAAEIEDPTKSWVIYSELQSAKTPQYYHFEMDAGVGIRLMLMIPIEYGLTGFRPSLALMGPGLANQSTPPSYLETPPHNGVMIFDSGVPRAEYEGFTPTSFYQLIGISMTAPENGTYYVAVYDSTGGGRYSIAVGYVESFTLDEWWLVPFGVMTIHLWSGQSYATIIAPFLAIPAFGIILVASQRRDLYARKNALTWVGITGSLLYVASGVSILYEMMIALLTAPFSLQVLVTIIFVLIPLLLGMAAFRIVLNSGWEKNRGKIVKLLIIGVVGPFAWAGLLIGPVMLLLVAFVPLVAGRLSRERHDAVTESV
jgi:hypothetical protein